MKFLTRCHFQEKYALLIVVLDLLTLEEAQRATIEADSAPKPVFTHAAAVICLMLCQL